MAHRIKPRENRDASRLETWRRRLVRHFAKNDRPVTFEAIVSSMPAISEILTPSEAASIADEVAALRKQK
jgi:hypothetical protein